MAKKSSIPKKIIEREIATTKAMADIARDLNISENTIYNLCNRYDIEYKDRKAYPAGPHIEKEDLREYLAQGLTDRGIGEKVGISGNRVCSWRKIYGFKPNYKRTEKLTYKYDNRKKSTSHIPVVELRSELTMQRKSEFERQFEEPLMMVNIQTGKVSVKGLKLSRSAEIAKIENS